MTTFSGKRIDLLQLAPADISIRDIAHQLALTNRFRGATQEPYNVAQHSLLVSYLSATPDLLEGLLHDAAEAYLGDQVKWVKDHLPDYRSLEDTVQAVIRVRHHLAPEQPESVTTADKLAFRFEAKQLGFKVHVPDGRKDYPPVKDWEEKDIFSVLPGSFITWKSSVDRREYKRLDWQESEALFLERYRELTEL